MIRFGAITVPYNLILYTKRGNMKFLPPGMRHQHLKRKSMRGFIHLQVVQDIKNTYSY